MEDEDSDGTYFRSRGCTFPFLPGESAVEFQDLQLSWLRVNRAATTVNEGVNNTIEMWIPPCEHT
jgi:hypothetical protein